MKNLVAIFDDRYTAWNAITELTRSHIVPRHEMVIEPLDSDNPNGRTRLTVKTKLRHETKDSIAVLKKYGPSDLTDDKGKTIKR